MQSVADFPYRLLTLLLGTPHSEVPKLTVGLWSWISMRNGVVHAKCVNQGTIISQLTHILHIKVIAPAYNALAASFPHVQFLRVDVDKQQAIAAKYKISAMPTFVAIVGGEVKDTVRGLASNGDVL
jgi:hypothetical protein